MSFMGESSAAGTFFGGLNQLSSARQRYQNRKLAEAGIELSGIMAGREGMRRAEMEQRLKRQRKKDLYAQGALETRMGNVALQGRPRAGGSVLGGRGRKG